MKIALVSCSSRKQHVISRAKDMYSSPLFLYSRQYAEKHDMWFILSAKYGLLYPDQVIETYDEYLGNKTKKEIDIWSHKVLDQLKHVVNGNEFVFLAGKKYRTSLSELIVSNGGTVLTPLAGLGIGQQLSWLKKETT